MLKNLKLEDIPKGIIKNYNSIINRKSFYDQPIYSDIKRYKEIRKLQQGKVNITLLDVCLILVA